MRVRLAVMVAVLALGFQGCTLRPLSQEATQRVDSFALTGDIAGAAQASPFCLHLQHHDRFWVVYSQVSVSAWVTDGRCDTAPSASSAQAAGSRQVDAIDLRWLPDWHHTPQQTSCTNSAQCAIKATDVIAGQHLVCASARARVGNQVAMVTTNAVRCP